MFFVCQLWIVEANKLSLGKSEQLISNLSNEKTNANSFIKT